LSRKFGGVRARSSIIRFQSAFLAKIQFGPAPEDGKPVSAVSSVEYEVRKSPGTNST
jgi:hypothetical protein